VLLVVLPFVVLLLAEGDPVSLVCVVYWVVVLDEFVVEFTVESFVELVVEFVVD
jgi:hypothetical protein